MARTQLTPALLAVGTMLLGGVSSKSVVRAVSGPRAQNARTEMQRDTPCLDCIHLERAAVLGERQGPGYVVATDFGVRDSAGRYWLGQYRDMIKVFDSTGSYLRQVGRQGAGPMEFGIPMPTFTDASGHVHVLDPRNARETIIGPDFELRGEERLPSSIWHAVALPNEGTYIANAAIGTSSGIGLPLHIIRGPEVLRSFGASAGGIVDPMTLFRVVTIGPSGRVYSTSPYQYRIRVWTADGEPVTEIEGPKVTEARPRGGVWSDDNPPLTKIVAMQVDAGGRLWVVISQRKDDWREHVVEIPRPGGQVALQPVDGDLSAVYRTRIDVIDPAQRAVIGRTELDNHLRAFIGEGLVIENRQRRDGTPEIAVWRVKWQPTAER